MIILSREETYTETTYRTLQYYCCLRYRVYLRRDLPGKHVIVVKIILCYAAVDPRRFFCQSPNNNKQRHIAGAEIDAKSETEKEKHRI